jgi:hypothetical protein
MKMTIKPIETHYKGYRFRSRLEARWAVFFDALGIKWEYEPEGYDLGEAGWYLPDFWLPQVDMWAEVKPKSLTPDELTKCVVIAGLTARPCLLLTGVPQNKVYPALIADSSIVDYLEYFKQHWQDYRGPGGYCLTCWHDYPNSEGRFYGSPGCDCDTKETGCETCGFDDTETAANIARRARFEHGEQPND